MDFWHDEIKRVQQNRSPPKKSKNISNSTGKWKFDLDSVRDNENKKLDSDDDEHNFDDLDEVSTKFSDEKKLPFEENQIVWVHLEEENCKWPALVQKIRAKTNQVLVFLIDIPNDFRSHSNKTVYSIDDVITFNNADQNIKFLDETKMKYDESIVKVVQKAEDYTRKKLLGEQLDINKLLGVRQMQLDNDKPLNKTIKIHTGNLLNYIKSDISVETHLLGIYKENIKSDLHSKYKLINAKLASTSSSNSNYGPFEWSEEDRDSLFNYCLDLFENNFKPDANFDVVDYVFDVMIPSVSVSCCLLCVIFVL